MPLAVQYSIRSGRADPQKGHAAPLGVNIEARFQEGEYQILILSAKDSGGLDTWLRQNNYKIPEGAAEALAPYIREQMKFFVAKMDITKVKRDAQGRCVLSPLRFSYDSAELRLPVRLGLLNAESKQDLLVYILSPDSRYELANYQNAFIPTNVEVSARSRATSALSTASSWTRPCARPAVARWSPSLPGRPRSCSAPSSRHGLVSYHCDPCPAPVTPPPSLSDWVTLGDKQILGELAEPDTGVMTKDFQLPAGVREQWVLTRLHTRYDKNTLKEDLIFRSGKPMVGGRANSDGTNREEGVAKCHRWPESISRSLHHPELLGRRGQVQASGVRNLDRPPIGWRSAD